MTRPPLQPSHVRALILMIAAIVFALNDAEPAVVMGFFILARIELLGEIVVLVEVAHRVKNDDERRK